MELLLRSAHRTKELAGAGYVPRRVTNSNTDMTQVDVLITTPFYLRAQNFDATQLASMSFHRLIVDESHLIDSAVGQRSANEAFPMSVLLKVKYKV